ncbi:transcriptional regulator MntR [Paenibacillus sp. 1011MAR3C5]|uniref:metal-dependent transcriptional regulator n=1 Tax=Paenibacillus sp. 1011MAR3C5 TaxID=1675787 RepID=UPI000E6C7A3F|nr:iron dependent repressor, metal binding and dimerization domain protein [Paenibacillus sp. 1011MAR3C5]RJE88948.1 transcriptional regulator MntR [Paenibacillus sp. 1011MAR3C5]
MTLTPVMEEDHLKQIYVLSRSTGCVRVSDVAAALSVHLSTVSKMALKLRECGYVIYEKYGQIASTYAGLRMGKQLLGKHRTLVSLLRHAGVPEAQACKEAERLEHYISWESASRLEALLGMLEENAAQDAPRKQENGYAGKLDRAR